MNGSGGRQQQQQQGRTGGGDAKERVHCDLCGSSASAVRCDKCSGQVFCLSCDDMYHRHPKRSAHVRKAVDSVQRPVRPPLPPKSDLQPPVPPPRRNKRFGLFGKKEQSPALPRKESASGVMGSLKRFMGVRPLPPPPTQTGGLSSVWEEPSVQPLPAVLGRPHAAQQRSLSRCSADSGRPPSDDASAALPATVTDINAEERHQRQLAQDRRDMDPGTGPLRPRSQSVTAQMTSPQQQHHQQQQQQQPWMYPQEHHQHQQHDMLQGFVTTRRGQSYRGGWPAMMAAGGSVCDMASPSAGLHLGHPGFHTHMMHAQSMAQLGCPTCHGHGQAVWYPAEPHEDHLQRYPSNNSLSGGYPSPAPAAGGRFVSQRDLRQPSPAPSARSARAARSRRLARSQMELSRYPTDSDEPASGVESDDESDRTPDETAAWACPHCTFQNSAGTRVCSMCCRTAPAAAAQQRAQKKRRRRRFPRVAMPPGSPAPLRARDPSPGAVSRGRERSERSVSRGPSLGRELAASELTDGVHAMKLEVQERQRERRPSDAVAAAPRRVSMASEVSAESAAQSSAGAGPSDTESGGVTAAPPPDTSQNSVRKQTQSTGTSPPPQTIATQTNEDAAMYSEGSLPRTGSRASLTGDYEPFRYGGRQAPNLKRTQSFQAFGQRERQERADPWLSFGTLGSRFQGRSGSKSSVHSTVSDSRAFGAYTSGASSRGESPARFTGTDRSHSRQHSYGGEMARKPADGSDYLVGLEEMMMSRKPDSSNSQGMELVLMLRDAEKHNFSPEDLQIALNHCAGRPPVPWLLDNLDSMIETVCTLATNYGHDRPENDVGTISNKEARDALRLHKGNVWSAVTECVEQRRKKYSQLAGRGSFSREDIITALTANHGSVEAAYLDLNRTQLKPFLMRIWGPPQGVEVNEGAPPGRPEVTPPPGGVAEVKVAPPQAAEVKVAPAGAAEVNAASAGLAEVKVAPSGSTEVKVAQTSAASTVLAPAKTDNSESRSDQCSTLSSELDSDDDEACKSKDYITPPTSPLPTRANPTVKPASDPVKTSSAAASSISATPQTQSGSSRSSNTGVLASAALPHPSAAPSLASPSATTSVADASSSSGRYEPTAKSAVIYSHQALDNVKQPPVKDHPVAGKDAPATASEAVQPAIEETHPHPQPQQQAPPQAQRQAQPQAQSQVQPQTQTRPLQDATGAPTVTGAVVSDCQLMESSSDESEPAVYSDLLMTSTPSGVTSALPASSSGALRSDERASPSGSPATARLQPDSAPVLSSQVPDLPTPPLVGTASAVNQSASSPTATETQHLKEPPYVIASSTSSSSVLNTASQDSPQTPATSPQYSFVRSPRPVLSSETSTLSSGSSAVETQRSAVPPTTEGATLQFSDKPQQPATPAPVLVAAVVSSAPEQETPPSTATEQSPVPGGQGESTPRSDTGSDEPQERRALDSSADTTGAAETTDQSARPGSFAAATSSIYASPARGAPRAAYVQATRPSADIATDTTSPSAASPPAAVTTTELSGSGTETAAELATSAADFSTTTPPTDAATPASSTAGAETTPGAAEPDRTAAEGGHGTAASAGPAATARDALTPIERLELAKRVICNHVQRQRPGAGVVSAGSAGGDASASTTLHPHPPAIRRVPSGPNIPPAADTPDIDDGGDYASVAYGPVGGPRTLRHATGDVTAGSDSSSEDVAAAGDHVVFTSSDSLSEGYEAVVSVRFQPGDGRGGGVRSSSRSPRPALPLVASSSAESLTRSDQQVGVGAVSGNPAAADAVAEAAVGSGVEAAEVDQQEPDETAGGSRTDSAAADSPVRTVETAPDPPPEDSRGGEPRGPETSDSSADQGAAAGSGASLGSESSDSDADPAAAGRPSDVDVAALKEGLKYGSSTVLKRTSCERQKVQRRASRLLRSGRARSQAEAEMASQLMALRFSADESLQAANQCSSLYSAVSFLHQECELCAGRYSAKEMVGMTHCTHRCCHGCAQAYFTQRIKERPLADLRCPFCNEPDLTSEEIASDYFSHLDIMLKTLVTPEVHSLFHKKLFDRAMMKDPNFKWCPKCSSGFIAAPRQQKLHCPDCGTVSCALCAKTWTGQHEGVSCEKFAMWQQQNDPNYQSAGLERHLAENGISCPNCRFRYALAKGGCMHFTCSQCKYEFCSGCGQPFSLGSRCGKTELCSRLGLHAHHPRNCLFYLRDKEPKQLQQLLKSNGIAYNTEPPGGTELYGDVPRRCRVQEQKETASGLRDDICGRVAFADNAGLCRMHYLEYLCGLVWQHRLDPVAISDASDLRQEMRRHGKRVRIQRVRESDEKYTAALRKLVETELPLDV